MADRTIKIEIPVEVLDNTSDGTKGVVQNLSKMEKAMLKMEKQARQHTSKMEESFSKTDEKMERVHDVELRAEDNATPVIHNVEDALDRVAGTSADVELGADDSATPVIKGVEDSVTQTDGTSADVELGADDSATPVIKGVEDSAESLGGASATVELGAEDNASSIIDMVRDKLHSLGGMAVSAVVGAADTASEVIDSVLDKLSSYEGTTWNATVGVVNAVTSPIGKIGGVIGNPLAQAGAVAGVSFGVADSVNTFKDFEQMMSSVKAISSATAAEFDALTDKAKQMGADTKFSAYESAEAFNYMAMAGWKPQQMIDGIAGVMNLAAASGEDLGSTSDIVTDAITAFGMQAGDATHFADVLAQASANANTNVGMLGESFKYVAPVAGAMKYSVEDTSLALGLMANASIKGSMAGTALKTSIANMASPTANMAAAMDKYGISLTETDGSMKSLKGVMDNLRTSLGGLSETEQTAAASTIFGKEAMSGMLAIINAAEEDYDKLTEAVYNADGTSERMAETMMDNLAGSFELLSGAMDEVKMTLGDRLSPYLKSGADALAEFMPEVKAGVTEFMDFVDSKAEKMKRTITSMTNSEEWADADFLGKVDIAWNELIGEPFMDWATGDGAHLV
ncbi:MAG: phage tail tape measure protein, partial [Clostridiales bacterium]|nr:phage tail tape measure protein [Clostridiales bacterium]